MEKSQAWPLFVIIRHIITPLLFSQILLEHHVTATKLSLLQDSGHEFLVLEAEFANLNCGNKMLCSNERQSILDYRACH